jgi:type II secretory pathway predicted ATPase ExeA
MYTKYWQLSKQPFGMGTDPAFYYPSDTHQGALLKLRYTIENRRGGGLLVGRSGLGKTLLVESLKDILPSSIVSMIHIVYPKMATHELLAYIAAKLGGDPDATFDSHLRQIEARLRDVAEQGGHVVLVIDEAHLLDSTDGFECLRLLLNFQMEGQPLMTVLLSGQTVLLPMFERFPGFEERVGIKCLLRPLNLEETASYVNYRLNVAGAGRLIFDDTALDLLYSITGGIPRRINRLCDLALLVGFAEQLPSISAEQIEAVNDELVTVAPE